MDLVGMGVGGCLQENLKEFLAHDRFLILVESLIDEQLYERLCFKLGNERSVWNFLVKHKGLGMIKA